MYLKDGREIIESDKYPGYYIDQSNGAWCDENGNYVGGNADNGDKPGNGQSVILDVPDYVYVSKKGNLYYPRPTAAATKRMRLEEAEMASYKPSRGYQAFVKKIYEKWKRQQNKKK